MNVDTLPILTFFSKKLDLLFLSTRNFEFFFVSSNFSNLPRTKTKYLALQVPSNILKKIPKSFCTYIECFASFASICLTFLQYGIYKCDFMQCNKGQKT